MPTLVVIPTEELIDDLPGQTSFLFDVADKFKFITFGLGFVVPTTTCRTLMAAKAVELAERLLIQRVEKWETELPGSVYQRRLIEVMAVCKEIERLASDWLLGEDTGIVASVSGPDGTVRDYYLKYSYGLYLAKDSNRYRNTYEFGDYILVSRHTGLTSKEPIETLCGYYPTKVSALIGLVRKMIKTPKLIKLENKNFCPASVYISSRYLALFFASIRRRKEIS